MPPVIYVTFAVVRCARFHCIPGIICFKASCHGNFSETGKRTRGSATPPAVTIDAHASPRPIEFVKHHHDGN